MDGDGDGDGDVIIAGVMKLKKTFTPPTTGPPQLAELVLVAAALQ